MRHEQQSPEYFVQTTAGGLACLLEVTIPDDAAPLEQIPQHAADLLTALRSVPVEPSDLMIELLRRTAWQDPLSVYDRLDLICELRKFVNQVEDYGADAE